MTLALILTGPPGSGKSSVLEALTTLLELADGRWIGFQDLDFEPPGWVDHTTKVGSLLAPGDRFGFVFDFGDDWRHECRVLDEKLDPRVEFGELPRR